MLDFVAQCVNIVSCQFDKTPTALTLTFEAFIFAGAIAAWFILSRLTPRLGLRFWVMSIGVLIFEVFTAPMWHNEHLGWWAYVYRDVSWVLTVGWATMILSVVILIDQGLPHWSPGRRFGLYLGLLTGLVAVFEIIVVNIGIRSYAPEVLASTSGMLMAGVPIELLYYTPVFTALVICFYKYWSFAIDDVLLVPVKKRHWWRSLLIALIGVVCFEIMIEPMVRNENLPSWSYFFHDISFLMTGLWILVVWVATNGVNKFMMSFGTAPRFLATVLLAGAIALPLESWFIIHGYRVYGASAVTNFTGFTTPITQVPVEIAFAIPCYMALVVAFIDHWEILLDNKL